MKKTDWYEGSQEPARSGVYERDMTDALGGDTLAPYSYWDTERKKWYLSCDSVEEAGEIRYEFPDQPSRYQNLPWRGIAK